MSFILRYMLFDTNVAATHVFQSQPIEGSFLPRELLFEHLHVR